MEEKKNKSVGKTDRIKQLLEIPRESFERLLTTMPAWLLYDTAHAIEHGNFLSIDDSDGWLRVFKMYKLAAEDGDIRAKTVTAGFFSMEEDALPAESALNDLLEAANKDYTPAMRLLALSCFRNGNYREALEWLTDAANLGDADACVELGDYHRDLGAFKKAREWYDKAVDMNNASAMFNMAFLSLKDESDSDEKKLEDLHFWLRRSADAGNVSAVDAALFDYLE